MNEESSARLHQVGVDVGGTFTDLVVADGYGRFRTLKLLSTPDDYSRAIVDGFATLAKSDAVRPASLDRLVHAFTVATNALLTGNGARVGLITTLGFRDVLEIGRLRMPRLYDMEWDKPTPLVRRRFRKEVRERIDAHGDIVDALVEDDVSRAVDELVADGIESIAVCLLHAYCNPAHERRIVDIVRERAPQVAISASHAVLPEMREYERTSTTVVNAFVKPVVADYLGRLESGLSRAGVRAPLLIMQSAGGVMPAATARQLPAYCIESGPAAGAIGAAELGRMLGLPNVIAFDMGGTTAKACLIENGEPRLADEMEVGAGINAGQRLLKGGGYVVRAPTIDLAEIGAGGGSLAWIDRGGALRVGPSSAGAHPGPVCYARGGEQPTVTDANVVLGFLNRHHLLDGEMSIDADAAEEAIERVLAHPLGLSVHETAWGIHTVANATMTRAVQAVSSEIGRSPSEFTMIAFGGSGPVHAATLAQHAGIAEIVIPPGPGVFSAFGLLFTRIEHRLLRTYRVDTRFVDLAALARLFDALRDEAAGILSAEGLRAEASDFEPSLDLRYVGQSSELSIPVLLPLGADDVTAVTDAFQREHQRTYGYHNPGEATEIVNLRLRARAKAGQPLDITSRAIGPVVERARQAGAAARRVYFGPDTGWHEAEVIRRASLQVRDGPLVIEEYDTTIVVPPGMRAQLDATGSIRLSTHASSGSR